jgi:long-chain acyl-CoA synthetase
MNFTRLFEILEYQQMRYPQAIAMAGRSQDQWQKWSCAEVLAERDRVSAGLLELDLHRHDRVGILAHCGSPHWTIADAAMLQMGIVPVPIHATARPDEIAHIVQDAALKACFVSNEEMFKKLREAGIFLDFILVLGEKVDIEVLEGEKIISWDMLKREPTQHELDKIKYLRDSITEKELATLLYTSGTTGLPKGVMLSHENIVSNIKSVMAIVPVGPETTVLSFLPLSHIFERMVTYAYQACGAPIWYVDAVENLPRILPEVRPHFMTAVPRILERMYDRLLKVRNQKGQLGRKIMDWAIRLGERYPYAGEREMPFDYHFKLVIADLLVYRHWRKRMGGRLQYIAVGAAALQPRLGRLFSAAGIDVREGYGLTETSPVIAFNRFEPGGVRFGTVGIAAPGVDLRIAAPDESGDGEIEVRGPNVMLGYLNLPQETAARFTPDGWFKTGDAGHIEHKKFLRITGRKSELFKTTTGKFVAPAYVEQQLLTSSLISQAMVLGANQPHVAALIVPNFETLENWCVENKVHWTAPQYMVLNNKVEKLFRQELDRLNEERLGPIEKVRTFKLLHEPWTPENGLLTPTLKLRRETISKEYEQEVFALF